MVAKSMIRLLTLFALILSNMAVAAASITIDRNTVRVNETFELTVNLSNQPDELPDLSSLPDDLEILSNNNFYRRSIINGRTTQQSGWRFTVRAKQEGIFTIPAIQVEGTQTQPLTIKVLPAVNSTEINGQPDAIRLTSEIDLSDVYVQQQIVYTIRLYRSVQAQYATLTEPVLEGSLIEQLGEDIQFDTVIDATAYRVLERKYAIYPQVSGEFEISGVVYTAEVSSGNRRFSTLGSLRGRNRSVSLTTEAQAIIVKPIPTDYNDWWLPAKQVELSQNWSSDTASLEVGTPVTWTYTIETQGLTATQIPDIQPAEVAGLKFYPEQAVSNNAYSDTDIVASRTQKIAVIPTKSGEITIPEVTIPWWNVNENRAMSLIIPSKTLTVLPSSETIMQPVQTEVLEPQITSTDMGDKTNLETMPVKTDTTQLLYWQIATASLALLWLATLFWRRSSKQTKINEVTSDTNNDTEQQPISLNEVSRLVQQDNAAASRKAIISYVQGLGYHISSLAGVMRLAPESELSRELQNLDKSLFGSENHAEWHAEKIIQELKELQPYSLRNKPEKQDALPPLHPE
ncbi:MAG: BatD family protein [Gammaproteobacteria bacterium]|nr:BatD family protein [Gammaproteobacteria bacterium]NNJ72456.1 protein BatD [Enterobacterales bacterium]